MKKPKILHDLCPYHLPTKFIERIPDFSVQNPKSLRIKHFKSLTYNMQSEVSTSLISKTGMISLIIFNLRRWSRRLILFYKIVNSLTSDYTRHQIPRLQEFNYDLRRHATVGQICARTQGFKSSSYPNCFSEWEKLGPEIKLSSSVNIFKKNYC